jgi:hypothetical protein
MQLFHLLFSSSYNAWFAASLSFLIMGMPSVDQDIYSLSRFRITTRGDSTEVNPIINHFKLGSASMLFVH